MMRILQILFLWLAGFTLLGHSVIPHHHHHSKEQVCAQEVPVSCDHEHRGNDHHHGIDSDLADNCFNHQHEQEEACSLNVNTYIEYQQIVLFALQSSNLFLSSPPTQSITYDNSNSGEINKCLCEQHSGRAPPILS